MSTGAIPHARFGTRSSPKHNNKQTPRRIRAARAAPRDNPPPFRATAIFRKKFRFVLEGPADIYNVSAITPTMLCRLMAVASSSTVVYSLFRSVRIIDCEIWAIDPNGSGSIDVYIEYPNSPGTGPGGPDLRKSDTSLGTATPAHVRYPPPRRSLQADWVNRNDVAILNVSGPKGAVLDLTLECVFEDSDHVASVTVAGASTGQLYYMCLDSLPSANYWIPAAHVNSVEVV